MSYNGSRVPEVWLLHSSYPRFWGHSVIQSRTPSQARDRHGWRSLELGLCYKIRITYSVLDVDIIPFAYHYQSDERQGPLAC